MLFFPYNLISGRKSQGVGALEEQEEVVEGVPPSNVVYVVSAFFLLWNIWLYKELKRGVL